MKTKVLVLGGGSGGISVAARLLRIRPDTRAMALMEGAKLIG